MGEIVTYSETFSQRSRSLLQLQILITKHYKMKRIVNINGKTKEEVLISKLEIENRDLKRQITELNQALQLQQTGVSGSVLSGIDLVKECAKIIVETQNGSVSLLQRRLDLSYNKASRIMDVLEEIKIVDQFSGEKKREVFIKNIEDLIPKLDEINVYNCRFV